MPERLGSLDVSFLYLEGDTTAMHVGGLVIFKVPDGGFDLEDLVELITQRIALVPRYRQKLRGVPGNIASPVWVDDEHFDVTYHVRRSALPRPGTDEQLRELVGRLIARPLDRDRPLWEMYLVEGLSDGRFALFTKTHHAMVDGASAVEIGQVILDLTPEPREIPPDTWEPEHEPTSFGLLASAVGDVVRRPTAVVDVVRGGVADVKMAAGKVAGSVGGLLSVARTASRPAPSSPLNVEIGTARRFATADTLLDDYKYIRKAHGGTVNDVVLAVVSGALRDWLTSRGESVTARTTVRAMVPVSIRTEAEQGKGGNRVAAYLVDLPVGEVSPVIRLSRVSYAMTAHKESGQAVAAEALVGVASFTPPTLHALGARVASGLSKRVFNVVVTNVPGPQFPLYAGGALMLAPYPVVPLAKGQALSIGLTSYNGGVFYGLNADRDAMPDVDDLAGFIVNALDELKATVR